MNQRRKGEGKDKKNHPRHSQVSVAARRRAWESGEQRRAARLARRFEHLFRNLVKLGALFGRELAHALLADLRYWRLRFRRRACRGVGALNRRLVVHCDFHLDRLDEGLKLRR
jgi:hypothetical protein